MKVCKEWTSRKPVPAIPWMALPTAASAFTAEHECTRVDGAHLCAVLWRPSEKRNGSCIYLWHGHSSATRTSTSQGTQVGKGFLLHPLFPQPIPAPTSRTTSRNGGWKLRGAARGTHAPPSTRGWRGPHARQRRAVGSGCLCPEAPPAWCAAGAGGAAPRGRPRRGRPRVDARRQCRAAPARDPRVRARCVHFHPLFGGKAALFLLAAFFSNAL